jgi:hypothetical protein
MEFMMVDLVPETLFPPDDLFDRQQGHLEKKEFCKHEFFANFQEISPNLFTFHAQDPLRSLSCSFPLDIQNVCLQEGLQYEDHCLVPMAVCNFPAIDGQILHEKVFGNEYLQGMVLVRFHLNILESLFLFCDAQGAEGLVLTVDDTALSVLDIFQPFLVSERQVTTEKENQVQVIISTNLEAYDELMDLIDKMDQDFRETLWRDQGQSPAIRAYLKKYAFSDL